MYKSLFLLNNIHLILVETDVVVVVVDVAGAELLVHEG